MSENGSVKIRLSTVICIIIIFVLIVALGVVYYFGFINNKEVSELKAQKEDLETKIVESKETNIIATNNTTANSFKKEIFRQDFAASSGNTFNMTVDELTTELMKRFKSSNPESTVELKELSGAVDWVAIGWPEGELEVTGINIYSTNGYVDNIICTPAKYGSGDVDAIAIPENLYEEAKKILGSDTEEWKELEKEGKIKEKIYDAFTGEEVKTDYLYAGLEKSLYISR